MMEEGTIQEFERFIEVVEERFAEYDRLPLIAQATPSAQVVAKLKADFAKARAGEGSPLLVQAFCAYKLALRFGGEDTFLPLPVVPEDQMPLQDDAEAINLSGTITAHTLSQRRVPFTDANGHKGEKVTHLVTIQIETDDEQAVRKLFGTRFQQKHVQRADIIVWPRFI